MMSAGRTRNPEYAGSTATAIADQIVWPQSSVRQQNAERTNAPLVRRHQSHHGEGVSIGVDELLKL